MDRLTNQDICAGRHGGNPESVEALASISREALSAQGQKVFDCIARWPGGLTGFEIENMTGLPHQSVSVRLSGLQKKGRIVRRPLFPPPEKGPAYLRRRTASGSYAAMFVAAVL